MYVNQVRLTQRRRMGESAGATAVVAFELRAGTYRDLKLSSTSNAGRPKILLCFQHTMYFYYCCSAAIFVCGAFYDTCPVLTPSLRCIWSTVVYDDRC